MGKDSANATLDCSHMSTGTEMECSFEERVAVCTEIAKPMCSKKTLSRIHKLIKKASKDPKVNMVYGTKSVQRAIRRDNKGLVLLSGSVRPIETLCHVPSVCESKDLPYIYVPCNEDLQGGKIARAPVMMIFPKEDYKEAYDKVLEDVKSAPCCY